MMLLRPRRPALARSAVPMCGGGAHARAAAAAARHMSGLPYRIRSPLAKLVERKTAASGAQVAPAAGGLGDGEKLETNATGPDYVRLALTSRVYDMVSETPLQYASGLSERLGANVHLKREDLLPSFSFKLRGAYNLLANLPPESSQVVSASVGSQGLSVAVAARELGIEATVVVPERTPHKRRQAIERAGGTVVVSGKTLSESQHEARRLAEESPHLELVPSHDNPMIIAGQATAGLEVVKQMGAVLGSDGGAGEELDAIFVVAGGSSLLAGVAAVMKAVMPRTKVIGVEAASADLLHRSLLSGHTLAVPEPAHFVDGASVRTPQRRRRGLPPERMRCPCACIHTRPPAAGACILTGEPAGRRGLPVVQ